MPHELPIPGCLGAQPAASSTQGVPEASLGPRDTARSILQRSAGRVGRLLRLWRSRLRESHELSLLSDRELRDMNVSRYDIAKAMRKPFWRA
jgi:uncharacterized protein YjiS (DUF1127 family)